MSNKKSRLEKLQENVDVLNEMFEFQNKEEQRKLLAGEASSTVGIQIDIEGQMMVKDRKGASNGLKFEGFK